MYSYLCVMQAKSHSKIQDYVQQQLSSVALPSSFCATFDPWLVNIYRVNVLLGFMIILYHLAIYFTNTRSPRVVVVVKINLYGHYIVQL